MPFSRRSINRTPPMVRLIGFWIAAGRDMAVDVVGCRWGKGRMGYQPVWICFLFEFAAFSQPANWVRVVGWP